MAVQLSVLVGLSSALVLPSAPTSRACRHAAPACGLFDFMKGDDDAPGAPSGPVPRGFVEASHILLAPGADADERARILMDNIDTGEISFADAAKQFSQCPSKGKGGSLGSFRKLGTLLFLPYEGQDVPEFDAAVWSSPIGEVGAVTTSFGVHLLRVDARGSPE